MLEHVAARRVYWEQVPRDWAEYDVLIALPDCRLLGRDGWMAVGRQLYTVMVVDCEQQAHAGQMIERGLLADVNLRERGEALLVLR